MFHVNPLPSIKYRALFSLKNNDKVFINVSAAVVIGALMVNGTLVLGVISLSFVLVFIS